MSGARITSYAVFWPHYLREHARPQTRAWHYLGTSLALLGVASFILTRRPWFLVGAVTAGYAPAWIGHFFVEKNRPATFQHPTWSLISDFRMFAAWLGGSLAAELAKAKATDPED